MRHQKIGVDDVFGEIVGDFAEKIEIPEKSISEGLQLIFMEKLEYSGNRQGLILKLSPNETI